MHMQVKDTQQIKMISNDAEAIAIPTTEPFIILVSVTDMGVLEVTIRKQ